MNLKSRLKSAVAYLLFLVGVLVGSVLSASVTWGQMEAALYTSFNGNARLHLECPFMLSSEESSVIRADIVNDLDEEITPRVSAEISHDRIPRRVDQTVVLAAGASETVEWTVNPSHVIFNRLIVVNILQSPYAENPSFLGSCGILVFSLFGMTGAQTFRFVFGISLAAMLAGGALWINMLRPLNHFSKNLVQINAVLLGITILALWSTIPRWWGLTLFFDVLILLVVGVMITEFGLFPQKSRD